MCFCSKRVCASFVLRMSVPDAARTITHNDNVGEILANIRRGPFSPPSESEKVEYLFSRVKTSCRRPDFEAYALEHVLSFQRRVAETKDIFMRRNVRTPLGILMDWWCSG